MAGRARRGRREGGVVGPGGGVWHGGRGKWAVRAGQVPLGGATRWERGGRDRSEDDPSQQEIQAAKDDLDKNEKAVARKRKELKKVVKSWAQEIIRTHRVWAH